MPVQVQQEQLEPCRVSLTIEVPSEDVQKAVQTVFNQVHAVRAGSHFVASVVVQHKLIHSEFYLFINIYRKRAAQRWPA